MGSDRGRERRRAALLAAAVILAVAAALLLAPGTGVGPGAADPPPEDESRPPETLPPPPEVGESAMPAPVVEPSDPKKNALPPPAPLPLEVELVDSRTGTLLTGAEVALDRGDGTWADLEAEGSRYVLGNLPFRRGMAGRVDLRIRALRGYAVYPREARVTARISRLAGRVLFRIPVRREVPLLVRVVTEDGRPVGDAEVFVVSMVGRCIGTGPWKTASDGTVRVGGVPLIPGESIVVGARLDGRFGYSAVHILTRGSTGLTAEVVLPDSPGGEQTVLSREDRDAFVNAFDMELEFGAPPGMPTGALEVRVTRRDGGPARKIRVTAYGNNHGMLLSVTVRTDAEGLAKFEELPMGPVRIGVTETGFLMFKPASAVVEAGKTVRLTILEPAGCTADVILTDADGMPARFARLWVRFHVGGPYVLVEGDRQHLVLLTDERGRATIYNLPPAGAKIFANFGSRSVEGEAVPGETLRLTLPR